MIERNGFSLVLGAIGVAALVLGVWRFAVGENGGPHLAGALSLMATAVMLWRRKIV